MESIIACTLLLISMMSYVDVTEPTVSVDSVIVNRTGGTPVLLIHVASLDEKSSTHLLWGTGEKLFPSFLLVQSSDPNDHVEVNVSQRDPVLTIRNATQSYGLIFLKLVEYNDSNDKVSFSKLTEHIKYTNFRELNWKMQTPVVPHTLEKDEVLTTEFIGERSPSGTGSVHIKVMASASLQRNLVSPRLVFLPGMSVQVECALVGLNTTYSAGRFGLQLVLVSSQGLRQGEDFAEDVVYSLDDEFSPGSFKTINLHLDRPVNSSQAEVEIKVDSRTPDGGFLQLRPVSYASPDTRGVKSSRNLLLDDRRRNLSLAETAETRDTANFWFYGSRMLEPQGPVGVRLQNVSLGSEQDGFYVSSSYLVWTLSMGIGRAPEDRFSTQLLVLLVFSMVLVAAAIFVGTAVVFVMRRRYKRPAFQRLANLDDDTGYEQKEARSVA